MATAPPKDTTLAWMRDTETLAARSFTNSIPRSRAHYTTRSLPDGFENWARYADINKFAEFMDDVLDVDGHDTAKSVLVHAACRRITCFSGPSGMSDAHSPFSNVLECDGVADGDYAKPMYWLTKIVDTNARQTLHAMYHGLTDGVSHVRRSDLMLLLKRVHAPCDDRHDCTCFCCACDHEGGTPTCRRGYCACRPCVCTTRRAKSDMARDLTNILLEWKCMECYGTDEECVYLMDEPGQCGNE